MAQVYCTMVLTDGYLPGALTLAHSLRDGGTTRQLAVIIPDEGLSGNTIRELERVYDHVIPVERIYNRSPANLMLLGRLELGVTFTKIKLWSLVQFSKIVYVDADVLALQAPDELFDVDAPFAAAPDIGWPDCFNSGVMVLTPDMGTYNALLNLAQSGVSFDGADQGLLNIHFQNWHRVSFVYNVTPSASYQYAPAYRHYGSNIKMVHFIGANKPWLGSRSDAGGKDVSTPSSYNELLSRWWAVWDKHYRPLSEQDPKVTQRGTLGFGSRSGAGGPGHQAASGPWEYDPNFRRDHTRHDHTEPSKTSWQPPPKAGENSEKKVEEPHQQAWQPSTSSHFHHSSFQVQHDQPQYPPVSPIYLPKEAVPYVPREMPYSMYSQSHIPESVYHLHQELVKQEIHHHQSPAQPSGQKHDNQQAHPVHRRFSVEDIQERADNALPLPPVIKETEESNEPRDQLQQPKSKPEAPAQNWDPAKGSPPKGTAPEAKQLPQKVYEWDTSKEAANFVPPKQKSPPKNLNYELPPKPPAGPARVFPWEGKGKKAQTTSRYFAEDAARPPPLNLKKEEKEPVVERQSPVDIKATSGDDWSNYSLVNAWDNDPEIHRYMESFQKFTRPGKRGDMTPKPVFRVGDLTVRDDAVEGEPNIVPPELPVTPNPVRSRGRASVLDDEEKFPSAKGIPSQQDWDPEQQLEELKNAPGHLLQKGPPSPTSAGLSSPRSPGEYRVSSSVPVPQLPHMITAYIEGHRRASLLSSESPNAAALEALQQEEAVEAGEATLPPGTLKPTARRSSATQTEIPPIIEKAIQTSDGEFSPAGGSPTRKSIGTSTSTTSIAV